VLGLYDMKLMICLSCLAGHPSKGTLSGYDRPMP
jgi:hypothetical protein